MNYNEILEAIKATEITVSEFAYDDCENPIPGVGEYTEIDQYGGEGKGEEWYSVKHFPQHDVYIKISGYYSSYEGTDFSDEWGCCEEVRPVSKTITVYE